MFWRKTWNFSLQFSSLIWQSILGVPQTIPLYNFMIPFLDDPLMGSQKYCFGTVDHFWIETSDKNFDPFSKARKKINSRKIVGKSFLATSWFIKFDKKKKTFHFCCSIRKETLRHVSRKSSKISSDFSGEITCQNGKALF